MKFQIVFRKTTDASFKSWVKIVEADTKEAAIAKWQSEAKINNVFVRCNQLEA